MQLDQTQLDWIVELARKHGATRLNLFGSALDQPARARDVDIACDGVAGWSLYTLGGQLEEMLRTSVDVVPLQPATQFCSTAIDRRVALHTTAAQEGNTDAIRHRRVETQPSDITQVFQGRRSPRRAERCIAACAPLRCYL